MQPTMLLCRLQKNINQLIVQILTQSRCLGFTSDVPETTELDCCAEDIMVNGRSEMARSCRS